MDIQEKIKHWETNDGVKLLKRIGLGPGASVIDFGCGYGHYSVAASLAVENNGKVYGIDNDRKVFKFIKEKIKEYQLESLIPVQTNGELKLSNEDKTIDFVLLYDLIHSCDIKTKYPIRFSLYPEIKRVLKETGIFSILPFHFENMRDETAKKRKYTHEKIIQELSGFGFQYINKIDDEGIHFEKYHSPYYWQKGEVKFDDLEKGTILNFLNG